MEVSSVPVGRSRSAASIWEVPWHGTLRQVAPPTPPQKKKKRRLDPLVM